ncbi:MAG: ATP-binding cassette domain-containing protein [Desulfobacterales bacterium]|nr:ATP-binding cassette domain-containing protein [Desulfobacterales bacterium]
MIKIDNLTKYYKKFHALKGINLEVQKGELFAYLGPNGAGKTTTISILTGLASATSGTAFLNGFDIKKESLMAKRQYGFVPQSINLDRDLSVYENLFIHGLLYGMSIVNIKKKIDALLEYVDIIDRKKSIVKDLSGGMKRRVMIARALMHEPVILFLDEPTVGLDANIRRKIWALIKKIQQKSATIFLTTHYIEEAEFLAQRVAFLNEGTIVSIDNPQNFIEKQGTWAIDRVISDNIETIYFKTREDANHYNSCQDECFTLRRVNLEDAFLALTGKKVQ